MTVACNFDGYAAPTVGVTNRVDGVLSTSQSASQSFLRFHNVGGAAGTVAVTVRNASTGATLGEWTSPSIPVDSELQFGVATIESALGITTNKPDRYSLSIRSGISGLFQHVLYRPSDGTLTNLSTCAAGVTADQTKISGVHSSQLQSGFPSTVLITNTSNAATAVTLGIYDARNGTKRGTYATPSIPAGAQAQVSVPAIETAVGTAPAGMFHYVVKTESAFTGYMQNLVNNVQAGVTTDMTVACALTAAPSASSVVFYVSSTGNDSWTGRLADPNPSGTDGPFLTIARAITAARAQDKAGLNQIAIQLRGGTYQLQSTLQFTAQDSGTPATEVIFQSFPGETAVLSGGLRIQNWNNAGGNVWRANLPTSTVNFESLFYNGARRVRARVGGALGAYLRVAEPVYLAGAAPPAAAPHPNCPTFAQGSGWLCYDRFKFKAGDAITNTWRNLVASQNNLCALTPGNANLVGDISVLIFEQSNVSRLRISCVDAANRIVYLTGPTAFDRTTAGFAAERRYLVENVQDALTEAGQWFLDRSNSQFVLNYLTNPNEDPTVDTVMIPQLSQLVAVNGVQHFTLQNITLQFDNYTAPAAGLKSGDVQQTVPPALSIQNSRYVTLDNVTIARTSGNGVDIISCNSAATSNPSWCVSNADNPSIGNIVIQNSSFFDLAASAISVGRQQRSADTDTNVPQHVTVRNSVVAGFGRNYPGAAGIHQGAAHNVHYIGNEILNGYKAGISICPCGDRGPSSRGAFNNVVAFNRIYNMSQGIMNDGGGIRITAGDASATAYGNKVTNNRIYDVSDASSLDTDGFGGDGIAVDDRTGLVDIQNNLVYRVSRAGVSFGSAPPAANQANIVKNNILAFTRGSAINNSRPYPTGAAPSQPIRVFSATNNIFLFTRTDTSSPAFYAQGGCSFSGGAPFGQFQERRSNVYWRTDGGFASYAKAFHIQPTAGPAGADTICQNTESAWTFYTFSGWQGQGQDLSSIVANPGFANTASTADDYTLPSGSPGAGFKVFDTTIPGRSCL